MNVGIGDYFLKLNAINLKKFLLYLKTSAYTATLSR